MNALALVAWLRSRPRALLIGGAAVAALVVVGLVAKSCAAPTREVTTHQATTDSAKFAAILAQLEQNRQKDVHSETVETKAPDGTVTKRTVRDEHATTATRQTTATSSAETTHAEVKDTHLVERARPDWRASAAALWRPGALTAAPPVLHGQLSRRILGPGFLGVAGQYDRDLPPGKRLAVGVVISGEW